MRGMLTITMLSGVIVTTPASADWQGTVWGQTEQEVLQILQMPHFPPPEEIKFSWFGYEAKIMFDYAVGDIVFKRDHNMFLFDQQGRLAAIVLKTEDPYKCDKLMDIMKRVYTFPPAKDEIVRLDVKTDDPNKGYMHSLLWYDDKNHNQVYVRFKHWGYGIEDDCNIEYTPYLIPRKGGL